LGVISYFSLASGFLSGKYRSKNDLSNRACGNMSCDHTHRPLFTRADFPPIFIRAFFDKISKMNPAHTGKPDWVIADFWNSL
jgi:aryl-alcohol dehydrogenase-like predicted oxidoreductase